jgi:hypothetical protein
MDRAWRNTKENVVEGLIMGVVAAVLLSAFVVVLYFVRGSGPFYRINSSLPQAIIMYFLAGLLAGGAGGLLSPLSKTRLGAILVGIIAAALPSYLITRAISRPEWAHVVPLASCISAIALGGIYGWGFWSSAKDEEQSRLRRTMPRAH